ncbi:hypothetical protein KI387_033532, partial [Taxus chinensis]
AARILNGHSEFKFVENEPTAMEISYDASLRTFEKDKPVIDAMTKLQYMHSSQALHSKMN